MSYGPSPPRLRPLSARRSAILSVLDVGTSKVVCLVAKLEPVEAGSCRAAARTSAAFSASAISARAA